MLNTGDMAVLGWNALNDTITFSTLVDLPAGTVIKFTDKGWVQSTDAFTTTSTGDGVITWTVGSLLTPGSVFELFLGGSDEITTLINKTANVNLTADIVSNGFTVTEPMNTVGDSIFIYQGDDSNPFFIFGMNNSAGPVDITNWNASIGITLRDSMLPNGVGSQNSLTNGTNAIGLPGGASQLDNVQYTGPTGIADKATWLVRISDAANWTGDDAGTISTSAGSSIQIGVPNGAPVFNTSSKANVAENSTAVATLMATDADGDTLTYSITGGVDQALFNLDTKSGALIFNSAPDFEMPGDSNTDNAYDVEVTANDGQGGTTPLTLTVAVTNVNEAPTLSVNAKMSVPENTSGTVYTAAASDPENTPLFYTLSGTDAGLFNLDTNTGALSFKNAPDRETPADADGNNIYYVNLTANDGSLNSGPQALSIMVTDVDDGNAAPVFTSSSKASVAENTTAVATLMATDADGDTLTYSITGGADQALFNLDTKSGALIFNSAPDFEMPTDSNGDNAYDVEVTASDNQGSDTPLTLTVSVTNTNEAPTLTGATKANVSENSTGIIYTATGSDPENDTLTYTLGGTDAALFDLDANSGALSFKSAPDFEAPADSGGDNVYDVILTASDGSLNSNSQALAIAVTDVDDTNNAPVFTTSSKASVVENTTAVTTLAATDADGDTLKYSISGGTDQPLFALDANSGVLTFINAPDFEAPGDSNSDSAYDVEVTANDGQGTTPLTLTVTVTDTNEAPTLTGATKANVSENSTGTIYTATGSDPENNPLIYKLSGTDAALFDLDANSGALSFKSAPDFEAPADAGGDNVYDLTLTASDGSLVSNTQTLTINVTNTNDAPIFSTSPSLSVAENSTKVSTLIATDTDGGTLTYSINDGADAGLFLLDANSGALTFTAARDFEVPSDGDNDGVYEVDVVANDGQGGSTPLSLEVTVTDVNEAPTLSGATKANVDENSTGTIYTATGSDPENNPLIYTLSGTDAALFDFNANSGALSFKSAPDFEAPADAGGDNIYDIVLTASDGSLSSNTQALAILVDNINEAPELVTNTGATVTVGRTVILTSAMLVASDDDDGSADLTYTLTSLPASGKLTLSDAALTQGDIFTQQDVEDGLVVFAAGGSAGEVTVGITLADGGEDGAASVSSTLSIAVQSRQLIPQPDIQVAPTPGEPLPETPSGQPSVSETISNNGSNSGSVRLVENTGNSNVVTATLPGRVSLLHEGARTATDRGMALEDLIASIDGKTPANLLDQTSVASQWLATRTEGTLLDIRTLTFSGTTASSDPIVLTGTDNDNGAVSNQEAFVIDVSGLPQGNQIQLDNIDFASIVGSTTIRGGAGNNVVIGDDAAQTIVLGEGDDELYGGGGNDVIGSEGGDDRLFGDSGDDELFGGEGVDLLHGGSDRDVASYEGNREDYTITQRFGVITVQAKDDESDIDTLINIETLTFADDELALSYDEDLQWITGLYTQVLGRQADVEGVQYWAEQSANGVSRAEMALSMLNSEESGRVVQEDGDYLDLLYSGLFGRDADDAGKAYWSEQVAAGATLREVVDGFMFSDEIRSHDLDAVQWDFLV